MARAEKCSGPDPEVPLTRGVGSVESELEVIRPTPKATRSCSSSWPYPSIDVPQSENAQPGEVSATAANPKPAQPGDFEAPAQLSDKPRWLKRARHCSGYCAEPNKG